MRPITLYNVYYMPQDKECKENSLCYFTTKTYIAGTQKNRLNETVLLSIENLCLN